jgi:bacterioferritin-associated ferredoxin
MAAGNAIIEFSNDIKEAYDVSSNCGSCVDL